MFIAHHLRGRFIMILSVNNKQQHQLKGAYIFCALRLRLQFIMAFALIRFSHVVGAFVFAVTLFQSFILSNGVVAAATTYTTEEAGNRIHEGSSMVLRSHIRTGKFNTAVGDNSSDTVAPIKYAEQRNDQYRYNSHSHRRLGYFDDRCEKIVNSTLENIFTRQDCECEPNIFPPTMTVKCQRTNTTICLIPSTEILCGIPGITITFNIWNVIVGGLPIIAEICFYDLSVFDFTVPNIINPFCVGIFGRTPGSIPLMNLFNAIFGIVSASSSKETTSTTSITANDDTATLGPCIAKLGDDECQSCEICNPLRGGGGMKFDCSNIQPELVSTECTIVPPFA
jgi:hypothetical protein